MSSATTGRRETESVRTAALLARLDQQAERVATLEAEHAAQRDEIARPRATAQRTSSPVEAREREPKVRRRGMLRKILGATAAAAVLTIARETPVAAVSGGSDGGALVIAANDIFGALPRSKNTEVNPTQLTNTSGTVTASPTSFFHQGAGLIVTASDNAEGIMGLANGPYGIGIWGVSNRGRAVYGELTGSGPADGGKAVEGDALSNTNAYGVYGAASSASSVGVYGQGNLGIGVKGSSNGGIGVYGFSTSNHGAGGTTRAVGYAGLFGYTDVPGASALLGISSPANGTAGYFHGAVFVDGSFQVLNGPKSALIAHPDGSHRRVYCQESPEPWFEDFGRATLQGGRAEISLDADFDAVVKGDDYDVFLTEYGDLGGLYVSDRQPHRFVVRSRGSAVGSFSYRVVARRRDDVGRRMEKVELPKMAPVDIEGLNRPPGASRQGR